MVVFLRDKHNVKTRKDTYCVWCNESIKKGEKCYSNTSVVDDTVHYTHMHGDCYDAWQCLLSEPGFWHPEDFAWGEYPRGGTEP